MLAWFRVHASHIAALAIVSLAAVGVSIASPHADDCHDPACLGMAIEHDADAHRWVAPPTGEDLQPLHCLICHWLRTFRPRTAARVVSIPASDAGVSLRMEVFAVSTTAPAVQPPLRGPPVSPLA